MIDETNNKMSITKILLFFFLIVIAVGIAMMLLLPLFAWDSRKENWQDRRNKQDQYIDCCLLERWRIEVMRSVFLNCLLRTKTAAFQRGQWSDIQQWTVSAITARCVSVLSAPSIYSSFVAGSGGGGYGSTLSWGKQCEPRGLWHSLLLDEQWVARAGHVANVFEDDLDRFVNGDLYGATCYRLLSSSEDRDGQKAAN
jgi:hypothetical protein